MMTPTSAQAIATGSACRAPSASPVTAMRSASPSRRSRWMRTISTVMIAKNVITPNCTKPAHAKPSSTQNRKRSGRLRTPDSTAAPKIRITVRPRPTVPEKSGV